MQFANIEVVRTVKRLSEAIGYLELGMTRQATACLDTVRQPGPFAAIAEMLRGEAARRENRFDDATRSFQAAAHMLPDADNRAIWLALSAFHRRAGNANLAIETLARARGARLPKTRPNVE